MLKVSEESRVKSAIKEWEKSRLIYLSGSRKFTKVVGEVVERLINDEGFDEAIEFIDELPASPETVNIKNSIVKLKLELEEGQDD